MESGPRENFTFENIRVGPNRENLVIGPSRAMREVAAVLSRLVDTTVSVLIQGESGTGKELLAKALHFSGPRARQPFVDVNCSAIPEGLIESELFGHERGAFTGAISRREGKIERANGGTLFMDEIGEMPLPLQAKMLRVLQEREFERVGGSEKIKVDIRLIAATNRDLNAEVKQGNFREDLYYRVAVFPIQLPPLRERREDIPILVAHFLSVYAEEQGKPKLSVSPEAMTCLTSYSWPGNVRELQNVLQRAIVLADADVIKPEHLAEQVISGSSSPIARHGGAVPELDEAQVLTIDELERWAIDRALKICRGNVTLAAKRLGIGRATFYRKVEGYGLIKRGARAETPESK